MLTLRMCSGSEVQEFSGSWAVTSRNGLIHNGATHGVVGRLPLRSMGRLLRRTSENKTSTYSGEKRHEEGPGFLAALALWPVPRLERSTFSYGATTLLGVENSEVLPPVPVAVAVIVCPTVNFFTSLKVKEALPPASVLTAFSPKNFLPSLPEGFE
jgi:hypothetical protein